MKKTLITFTIGLVVFATLSTISKSKSTLTSNFIEGNPEISSINALSFGPEGILFLGDSKNAAVYALDTKDTYVKEEAEEINISDFDTKIAASLGTTKDNIKITDMEVNPLSKKVYFSVNTQDGTPVLLKLNGDNFDNISLKNASYSKIDLADPVDIDQKDQRGRELRVWAISDLNYHKGKVLVSGLSNKEFGSTFRSIPFPFTNNQDYASLEIFHAAHGRYETHAPIKTFNVVNFDNKDYIIASYTCTPLVLFPLDDLKDKKHSKGRTVAELGSGNSPLDMISFQKDGKSYFLMSNTNRSVMRFNYDDIAKSKENLTEEVKEFAVAKGVNYVSLPMVNVLQLDNLDSNNVVYLQRFSDGDLVLKTRTTKWM